MRVSVVRLLHFINRAGNYCHRGSSRVLVRLVSDAGIAKSFQQLETPGRSTLLKPGTRSHVNHYNNLSRQSESGRAC